MNNRHTLVHRAVRPAVVVLLAALLLAACNALPTTSTRQTAAPDATVTGTVTYLQRSALPPDAVVTVRVEDVSLADAPSLVVGEQVIPTNGAQVPIPYAVGYNSADIVGNNRYVVSARIEDGAGRLLFINDTSIPVITGGAPTENVEIMTVPVGLGQGTGPTAGGATVSGVVTYRQRIALPDDAVVTVRVEDISRADAPAVLIGEQVIPINGSQVPVPFEVAYDPAAIREGNRYRAAARIEDAAGNLLFISDTVIPVITGGAPTENVEIMTVPVNAPEEAPDARVTGTVTYLQRSALPPDAVVIVRVEDISLADAPATLIGEQVIVTGGAQVPIPYEVPYSTADIIDNHRYRAAARIEDAQGKLLFISDTVIPVITNGAPTENVEILTVPVGAGPATTPEEGGAAVTGTVTYLQRSALPPDAVITVRLEDISIADAPATVIGEQIIPTNGAQVPIPYEVAYDPAAILENNRYRVAARIEDGGGNLLFISDTIIPVITGGAPTENVEILVTPAGGEPTGAAAVTGTVSYLQRIALPDTAVVVVQIQDVSLADAPATVIGEQVISTNGAQVPIPFAVPYNPADIVDNHSYNLSARIFDAPDGNLLFVSDTLRPVITGGAPTDNIDLVLVPVQ